MGKYADYRASLENLDVWPEGGLEAIDAAVSDDIATLQAGADATIATQAQQLAKLQEEIVLLQAHNYQLLTAPTTPADTGDNGTADEDENGGDDEFPDDAFEKEDED